MPQMWRFLLLLCLHADKIPLALLLRSKEPVKNRARSFFFFWGGGGGWGGGWIWKDKKMTWLVVVDHRFMENLKRFNFKL